jgi:hypothetical protein
MKKLALLLAALPLAVAGCTDASGIVAPKAPRFGTSAVNFTVAAETYEIRNHIQYDAFYAGGEVVVGQVLNGTPSQLGTVYADYGIGSFTQAANGVVHLSAYPYSGCVFLYWEINGWQIVYDDYIAVDDYPPTGVGTYDYHAYFQCTV